MNDLLWMLLRGWSIERWDRSGPDPRGVRVWVLSPSKWHLYHVDL